MTYLLFLTVDSGTKKRGCRFADLRGETTTLLVDEDSETKNMRQRARIIMFCVITFRQQKQTESEHVTINYSNSVFTYCYVYLV